MLPFFCKMHLAWLLAVLQNISKLPIWFRSVSAQFSNSMQKHWFFFPCRTHCCAKSYLTAMFCCHTHKTFTIGDVELLKPTSWQFCPLCGVLKIMLQPNLTFPKNKHEKFNILILLTPSSGNLGYTEPKVNFPLWFEFWSVVIWFWIMFQCLSNFWGAW